MSVKTLLTSERDFSNSETSEFFLYTILIINCNANVPV